jgi:tripeptide aminopeptidase
VTPISSFVASVRGSDLQQRLLGELDALVEEAIRVQQIPAPTFAEEHRAHYVEQQFHASGLADVAIDDLYNVYGRLPGRSPAAPALLVSAHTDTVFPADTNLTATRDADKVHAPGIGDNSLGVAALLCLLRILRPLPLETDVWFVANTREEGLGDLGGIRAVVDRLHAKIGACIVIEGMAFGQIYHAGIAVRRLRITTQAAGGHSWLHYGQPSAIHSLVRFAAKLTELSPPQQPRTTYNIGLIEGGRSVNSIATDASLTLDMRSEDAGALATLESQVMTALEACRARDKDVQFTVEVVGDRPAGALSTSHALVRAAKDALEATRMTPVFHTGSTDANLPLARGIPAVTIGITTGGNAHRTDEYIDLAPIPRGMWQLVLLALSTADGL